MALTAQEQRAKLALRALAAALVPPTDPEAEDRALGEWLKTAAWGQMARPMRQDARVLAEVVWSPAIVAACPAKPAAQPTSQDNAAARRAARRAQWRRFTLDGMPVPYALFNAELAAARGTAGAVAAFHAGRDARALCAVQRRAGRAARRAAALSYALFNAELAAARERRDAKP